MSVPDPAPILELLNGFRRSKTMFTAVSFGIFDRLHNSRASAAELAAMVEADTCAMERLLDSCAALGLLRKDGGVYENEPVADAYLRTAGPHSLWGYIHYSDTALYPMWGHLAEAVKEGSHRWGQTFGLDGPIFSSFFRTEESMRVFLLGMHGLGMITSPRVVEAFDLSGFHTMVDLGGASGHLVAAACERRPRLRGIVFDLPRIGAFAREQIARSAAAERIEFVGGDFFEDELPEADLYALGKILHDWNEEKIGRLLRRIADRLPAGGALLIAEKLLNEDGVGPVAANMQSLNMLVVTEGRERSLGEYTRMLQNAGFAKVEGRRTGASLDAVMAWK